MKIIFKGAIISVLAVFLTIHCHDVNKRYYYDYVEGLTADCNGVSALSDYIDYDMLRSDLKKYIKKSDFKFSDNDETFTFCNKFKDLDYNFECAGSWNNIYPTDKFGNGLSQRVTVDGTPYTVYVSLVFKPGFLFRPEIVDIDTYVASNT